LRPPLLVITNGAPGLIGAVERVYAASLRQRCLIHRVRNVTAKVSDADRDEVKADFWAIFDLPDHIEPGEAAVAEARRRAEVFADTWQARYPSAVACVLDDLPALTTFLRFPREHWRRIRHTNLIERTFGESRRRVKVIGRPGERSCLSLVWAVLDLVWAVLDRASRGWCGVDMNPTNVRLLHQLRADLHHPHDTTPEQPNDLPETVPAVA